MQTNGTENCSCQREKRSYNCAKDCDCGCKSNLLQEIYRCSRMAVDSIEYVKKFAEEASITELLNVQRAGYVAVSDEVEKRAAERNENVTATQIKEKAMLFGGIMMNALSEKTTSKLAEMMIQGTNMGIISLQKAINNNRNDEDLQLAEDLMQKLNDNQNALKKLLS